MGARYIDERAGNGDGKRNSGVNGTISGNDVDSTRVEAAQLAGQSQRVHYNRRLREKRLACVVHQSIALRHRRGNSNSKL